MYGFISRTIYGSCSKVINVLYGLGHPPTLEFGNQIGIRQSSNNSSHPKETSKRFHEVKLNHNQTEYVNIPIDSEESEEGN